MKLAMEHEILSGRVKVIPILTDDVWADAPESVKDKIFADFRGHFEEGMELLVARLGLSSLTDENENPCCKTTCPGGASLQQMRETLQTSP